MADKPDSLLLLLIMTIAILNHLFTFLAYDWYAGTDSYSYDVAGFQIVTGLLLDPYTLMFRAPLLPIVKNILYILFEGHQALFGWSLHLLGISTVFLSWKLGRRFSRLAGIVAGLFMALSLPISVYFHHLSVTTIYIPLLIVTSILFVDWIRKTDNKNSALLAVAVFLCSITRAEAVALIPIIALSGWAVRSKKSQVALFLGLSLFLYNSVCFINYKNLGYWGITKNVGFSLYVRVAYPADRLFSTANGPASRKVGDYYRSDIVLEMKGDKVDGDQNLMALDVAQYELGFLAADRLFLQAGIEAIKKHPIRFIEDSALRLLGQMDIYDPGLRHDEYSTETKSGHMWGFGEERMRDKQSSYVDVNLKRQAMDLISPLQWEKDYLTAKFFRAVGVSRELPEVPPAYQRTSDIGQANYGEYHEMYEGDCMLLTRLAVIHEFDEYFYWQYWGPGRWSTNMLKVLDGWDKILPYGALQKGLHSAMWFFWLAAIGLSDDRKNRIILLALLSFVVFSDVCQVFFSDNYGRRFFNFTVVFLWIGGVAGMELLVRRVWKKNL